MAIFPDVQPENVLKLAIAAALALLLFAVIRRLRGCKSASRGACSTRMPKAVFWMLVAVGVALALMASYRQPLRNANPTASVAVAPQPPAPPQLGESIEAMWEQLNANRIALDEDQRQLANAAKADVKTSATAIESAASDDAHDAAPQADALTSGPATAELIASVILKAAQAKAREQAPDRAEATEATAQLVASLIVEASESGATRRAAAAAKVAGATALDAVAVTRALSELIESAEELKALVNANSSDSPSAQPPAAAILAAAQGLQQNLVPAMKSEIDGQVASAHAGLDPSSSSRGHADSRPADGTSEAVAVSSRGGAPPAGDEDIFSHPEDLGGDAYRDTPIKLMRSLEPQDQRFPRPDWLYEPDDKLLSKSNQIVLTAGPYTSREECRDELLKTHVPRIIGERIRQLAIADSGDSSPDVPVLEKMHLDAVAILDKIYRDDYLEATLSPSVGDMLKAHVLVEFTPAEDKQLLAAWQNYARRTGVARVGLVASTILGSLGFVYGLLKLDTWTRGYYTKRLFLGVPAAIITAALALKAAMVGW